MTAVAKNVLQVTKQLLVAVLKVITRCTVFAGAERSIGSYTHLTSRNDSWMWFSFGPAGRYH